MENYKEKNKPRTDINNLQRKKSLAAKKMNCDLYNDKDMKLDGKNLMPCPSYGRSKANFKVDRIKKCDHRYNYLSNICERMFLKS